MGSKGTGSLGLRESLASITAGREAKEITAETAYEVAAAAFDREFTRMVQDMAKNMYERMVSDFRLCAERGKKIKSVLHLWFRPYYTYTGAKMQFSFSHEECRCLLLATGHTLHDGNLRITRRNLFGGRYHDISFSVEHKTDHTKADLVQLYGVRWKIWSDGKFFNMLKEEFQKRLGEDVSNVSYRLIRAPLKVDFRFGIAGFFDSMLAGFRDRESVRAKAKFIK